MNRDIKQEWDKVFIYLLREHHNKRPHDRRSDEEILKAITNSFVSAGIIRKEDDNYIFPDLDGYDLISYFEHIKPL